MVEVSGLDVERSGERVIRGATFTVHRGDYVGIVGPNGGGKSTLIQAILGILPHQAGSIRIFGTDIHHFRNWERVAYVSQHAINFDQQFPLTVRELVSLGRVSRRTLFRRLNPEDHRAVDEALRFMGISDLADRRIGCLSGGQKQRVFVAKALVRHPEIILLDEPVAGVDHDTEERFYKILSDLNTKQGITVLIVSHDLTVVFCRMSKVLCVNRTVCASEITPDTDPNELLKDAYGEHFHFVFHRHACTGVFDHG